MVIRVRRARRRAPGGRARTSMRQPRGDAGRAAAGPAASTASDAARGRSRRPATTRATSCSRSACCAFDPITGSSPRTTGRTRLLGSAAPGRLDGRVMEAFLDARLERPLDGVPVGGSATLEHRAGDGEPRRCVLRAQRGAAGDDLVVVLEDVTELRRLQQIRTEFIDNLGHELRTPLSTVTLLAETLAREAEARRRPGADARADRADRGGDRPPRPDGQRDAGPRPDRGRLPAAARTTTWTSAGSPTRPPSGCACSPSGSGVTLAVDVGPGLPHDPRRRGAARPGRRQPRPQRGEVQPRRRRGPGRASAATGDASRSR